MFLDEIKLNCFNAFKIKITLTLGQIISKKVKMVRQLTLGKVNSFQVFQFLVTHLSSQFRIYRTPEMDRR